MNRFGSSWRLLGIVALALTIAHCGDGGGDNDDFDDSGSPPAGTFFGTVSAGGAIRIQVGSIEEIAFDCDGQEIQETFSPPQPIGPDGSFDVRFTDGGRRFRVEGDFSSDDAVSGSIDDQDDECDVGFTATRGNAPATPTVTPTSGGTPTATPSTSDGRTVTPTQTPATPVPSCTANCPTGPTETRTPTPTPTGCPVAVAVLGNGGNEKVLDSGWTGLAHNATVVSDGKLTFTLECPTNARPCGVCTVGGPIQNLAADDGDINARRCTNDTSIKCTENAQCGSGTCQFFFGAPLPLSAGGISTCVTNQVNGAVTGTVDIESGAFASTLNLTSRVYNQISVDQPCPRCNGDATSNDGDAGGTCSGGTRNGQACDANGTSPVESFGTTSLDCPPQGIISALTIPLDGSSGSETQTLAANSPNCRGAGAQSQKCFCDADGAGESTRPNACLDDSTTTDVEGCQPISSGSNKGQCVGGPIDRVCSPLETFRSCLATSECNGGDTCVPVNRPCFLDNGVVGGSVEAEGEADAPDANGRSEPTFAALFCIPPVAQPAVNAAGGLPGLGRLELPLIAQQISTLP